MTIERKPMQRILELRLNVPAIELDRWAPTSQDTLVIPFQKQGLTGTVSINLDERAIAWDGAFPHTETDEEVDTWPAACSKIFVRIEGSSLNKPIEEKATYQSKPAHSLDFLAESDEDEAFLGIAHELIVEYVKRFVYYIQLKLGQYRVDLEQTLNLTMWQFFLETDAHWISNGVARAIETPPLLPLMLLEEPPAFENLEPLNKARWDYIQRAIVTTWGIEPRTVELLMAEAKRRYESSEYHLAAVQAISALEIELRVFIGRRCQKRGVRKLGQLHFYQALNTYLPLVLEAEEYSQWLEKRTATQSRTSLKFKIDELIKRCIEMNELRNDVIHSKGRLPSDKAEIVERGIVAVEWLLEFIDAAEAD